MKQILSYGGGVNSTALLLLLKDRGMEAEAIFVDHGGDYPSTYEYITYLQSHGYPITVIQPRPKGLDLYAYSIAHRKVPTRGLRWCTQDWKIAPFQKALEARGLPIIQYIGIDAGEEHRMRVSPVEGIQNDYPLVQWGLDRDACKQVIADHGLPVPDKSGCFFCPFQSKADWRRLRTDHPDLWCKALRMEAVNQDAAREKGKPIGYLTGRGMPLMEYTQADQGDLFGGFDRPCECGV